MSSGPLLLVPLLLGQPAEPSPPFIDTYFRQQWQNQKITPAARTSDHAFLRRASLDLLGRIPQLAELDVFFKDPPATRRGKLIERLLAHPDYAWHWAKIWEDWLLGASTDAVARQALHGWLRDHVAKNTSHKILAEQLLTASGSTRDNPAAHWYVAQRGQPFPESKWRDYGQYDMVPLTGLAGRLFLGRRVQCVECHDHAFTSELRQDHFHAFNGFFRQVAFRDKKAGKERWVEVDDDPKLNASGILPLERRNGLFLYTRPKYFDGPTWDAKFKQARRQFVTEQIVRDPDFARAHVQRLWGYLFDHGMSEYSDVDDPGEHNPVAHPKLLDHLAGRFSKADYDVKSLLRTICTSDVYALDSVANKSNDTPDHAKYFSRWQLRPLTPDQIVDSLLVVLLPDAEPKERVKVRADWLRQFAVPAPPPYSHCEAQKLGPSLAFPTEQMLWLMNGPSLQQAVAKAVTTLLQNKSDDEILHALFLRTLSRPPSPKEMKIVQGYGDRILRGEIRGDLAPAARRRVFVEDVLWSLLNCAEFATNH